MHLIITAKNQVNHSISYETAAWHKQLTAIPGEYALQRILVQGKVRYLTTLKGEIVSDNFQSLFGGCAIGNSYDTKQNAGKPENFMHSYSPSQLLTEDMLAPTEEGYEQLLLDAQVELADKIDILMRCLNDSKPESMQGHAQQLAEATALYSKIHTTIARRAYNAKNNGMGWSEKDLKV